MIFRVASSFTQCTTGRYCHECAQRTNPSVQVFKTAYSPISVASGIHTTRAHSLPLQQKTIFQHEHVGDNRETISITASEKYQPETAWFRVPRVARCRRHCHPLTNLSGRSRELLFALDNCVGPYRMQSMQQIVLQSSPHSSRSLTQVPSGQQNCSSAQSLSFVQPSAQWICIHMISSCTPRTMTSCQSKVRYGDHCWRSLPALAWCH